MLQGLKKKFQVFYLLEDLNTETLKKGISELLDSPNLYKKIKTECIRARVELNWEKESEKLLTLYQRIITSKK